MLLGSDKAILYKNNCLTLDQQRCWVDILGFDHLINGAEGVTNKGDRGIQLTNKALSMYKGHFLSGDVREPWTMSRRENLRNKFVRSISRLGQHLEETEEFDQAIDSYNKGIEIDELAERLYQRLMLCHQRSGNRTEAIKTYKRLKTLLASHLGIEPSRETEAIYRTLLTK